MQKDVPIFPLAKTYDHHHMLANQLLKISINLFYFKEGIQCCVLAFAIAMTIMPYQIKLIKKYRWYDVPDFRKAHATPIPTMGGIGIFIGMATACTIWLNFLKSPFLFTFSISLLALFLLGILDDLKDIPAIFKFLMQVGTALLIALSDVRITSFNGILGIYELPLALQYIFTIIAITAITNAFNLIDGIDGLAAGIGLMSLTAIGIYLTIGREPNTALIAFALAGALLGFLYYNFNPARIFMGDTGSLVLGFTVAVLCIRLVQLNTGTNAAISHAPVFAVSVVLIPIFDTVRVFALRISKGRSPFHPDRTHIHHLLTNNGWSHRFAARLICAIHGAILLLGLFSYLILQEVALALLVVMMLGATILFKKLLPAKS